jgi:hypothetical protein
MKRDDFAEGPEKARVIFGVAARARHA